MSESESKYRALIDVRSITGKGERKCADIIIPGWEPNKKVRIPLNQFPAELLGSVKADAFLYAEVNLAAEKAKQLNIRNFELVPPSITDILREREINP